MPRAQARSTAYLQGGGAQCALPPSKYAVNLFCERPKVQETKKHIFPFPEGSPTAGRGPKKKFGKTYKPNKMAASSIQCIFTGCRGPIDNGQKIPKKKFLSWTPFRKKPFPKSRWIESSNHCILRVFSECVDRIHRKSQVEKTVTEIDRGPPQSRRTEFRRRGPWGGPLCAVWKQ